MNIPCRVLHHWFSKQTIWQINTAFGLMFSVAYILNSSAPHSLMYQLQRALRRIGEPLGIDSGYVVLNLIFLLTGLVFFILIRNSNLAEKLKINSLTIYAFLLSNTLFLMLLVLSFVVDNLNWLSTNMFPLSVRTMIFVVSKTCLWIGASSFILTLIWHYWVKPNHKLQSLVEALLQTTPSYEHAGNSSKVGKVITMGVLISCLLIFGTSVKNEATDSTSNEQTSISTEQDSVVNTPKFNIVNWHKAVDITKPALTAEKNKNWNLALIEWTKLLNLFPYNVDVLLHRADAYEQLGQYESARIDARYATLLGSKDARVWASYCWNTLLAKKVNDAIGVCEQAQMVDPWDFSGSTNLAHAYLVNNDLKQAAIWYDKAIKQINNEEDLQAILEDFKLFKRLELSAQSIDQFQAALNRKGHAWLKTLAPVNALLKQAEDAESAGKYNEAVSLYQQHIEALQNIMGHESSQIVPDLSSLARLQTEMRQYQAAEESYQLLQKIVAQEFGKRHIKMSNILSAYGYMLSTAGRYDEAIKVYREAIDICKLKEGSNHPNMATLLNGLGSTYRKAGQFDNAIQPLHQAVEISLNQLLPDYQMLAKRVNNLGLIYDEVGNYETAKNYFTQALAMTEMSVGLSHIDVCQRIHNLGNLLVKTHRYEEAEKLYRRALSISESTPNPDNKIKSNAILDLAELLKILGKNEEAKQLYARISIYEKS